VGGLHAGERPARGGGASDATGAASVVEFDDLRYGFPGHPREGFWGVRVRLDADAKPVGPGERFERELPAPVSRLLLAIWRETLGLG
jgi:hypothetical protein